MITEKRYPIKLVAARTKLSAHVIRAWEKRYHLVDPARTDTNRRLYSEVDIEHLTLLRRLTEQGHAISSIADIDIPGLQHLLKDGVNDPGMEDMARVGKAENSADQLLQSCLQAIIEFKPELFEERLHQASFQLTQPVLIQSVIIPLINQIGELWHNGSIRIMHEHMATAILKPFLSNLRLAYRPNPAAPSILIAAPQGQLHEFGALIIALVAAAEGWRTTYLGVNLPADEIVAATMKIKPRVIALSIVYPANDSYLPQELLSIKTNIDHDIQIVVGGQISDSYRDVLEHINAPRIRDFDDFRQYLAKAEQL